MEIPIAHHQGFVEGQQPVGRLIRLDLVTIDAAQELRTSLYIMEPLGLTSLLDTVVDVSFSVIGPVPFQYMQEIQTGSMGSIRIHPFRQWRQLLREANLAS